MEFIDLKTQQARIDAAVRAGIDRVLRHGRFIMGPEVAELEGRLAAFVGVEHAVACASGTDALLMALLALDVQPGDRIVTTPFTFAATAEAIALLRAVPVFVDIDPHSYNLCPEALAAVLERTAGTEDAPVGVIAVDIFGQPARYDRIEPLCERHDVWLVEDAAQSFGAALADRRCGAFGRIATTSFFPAKPLGCYGDGGACFTADAQLAEALRSIRVHGQGRNKYDNVRLGINGRLDTLQAAVLLAKLDVFDDERCARQGVADRYATLLQAVPGLTVPAVPAPAQSVWAQYTLRSPRRDVVRAACAEAAVPTAVYYEKCLHLQAAYASARSPLPLPEAERASAEVFSVPMHPYLEADDQARVADAVRGALAGASVSGERISRAAP